MSATRSIVTIFNPAEKDRETLIDQFVVRLKKYDAIIKDIQTSKMKFPEQHYLIIGQRGSGKTTLLYRLKYAIQDDKKLNKWLVPIAFSEEQYNISDLASLWESTAANLEDIDDDFIGLSEEMEINQSTGNYEKVCFDLLLNKLKQHKKKLILFIDNFGDLLDKLSDIEGLRFREILITCPHIRIIGASAVPLEHTFDYKEPFLEQFKMVQLTGLSMEDTNLLLLKLAESYNEKELVEKIIQMEPGRVEVLRRLTGGVIRTVVLLFEIFIDNESGKSYNDLQVVLDRVTPLYKHRMDDLKPQQQKIIDAVAKSWDAVGAKDIAEKVRLESKVVSAQLRQLANNQIIDVIQTDTKNQLYILRERFFNIWYLMRHGRKGDKNKVLWLVRFIEAWCNQTELESRAKKYIKAVQAGKLDPHFTAMMTAAYANTCIPKELQHELITHSRSYLKKKSTSLATNLPTSDIELELKAQVAYSKGEYKKVEGYLLKLVEKEHSWAMYNLAVIYQGRFKNHKRAEKYYLMAIDREYVSAMYNLAILYEDEYKDFKQAEKYYLMAVDNMDDGAMYNLALLYEKTSKDYKRAEKYYLMAVKQKHTNATFNLAVLYENEYHDYKKAVKYYLMAVKKEHIGAIVNLALIYEFEFEFEDHKKAEKYCIMASKNGSLNGAALLASFYFRQNKKREEALQIISRAYRNNSASKNSHVYCLVLLWNDQIGTAIKITEDFIEDDEFSQAYSSLINLVLLLFLAKKQYHTVLKLFNESTINLKERFKPTYYALMYHMRDEYPNEYRKMGRELKETVDEIIKRIEQMAKIYA